MLLGTVSASEVVLTSLTSNKHCCQALSSVLVLYIAEYLHLDPDLKAVDILDRRTLQVCIAYGDFPGDYLQTL